MGLNNNESEETVESMLWEAKDLFQSALEESDSRSVRSIAAGLIKLVEALEREL